jgi:hypothetical protein
VGGGGRGWGRRREREQLVERRREKGIFPRNALVCVGSLILRQLLESVEVSPSPFCASGVG